MNSSVLVCFQIISSNHSKPFLSNLTHRPPIFCSSSLYFHCFLCASLLVSLATLTQTIAHLIQFAFVKEKQLATTSTPKTPFKNSHNNVYPLDSIHHLICFAVFSMINKIKLSHSKYVYEEYKFFSLVAPNSMIVEMVGLECTRKRAFADRAWYCGERVHQISMHFLTNLQSFEPIVNRRKFAMATTTSQSLRNLISGFKLLRIRVLNRRE